jgi:anti-sigma factor RsiW
VSCELTHSVLHGYLDGELDAVRAEDFERHLVSCSECVAVLEAQESLRSSLQRARLYERASAALRQKLNAQLGNPALRATAAAPRFASGRWLAAAAAFLIVILFGWRLLPGLLGSRETPLAASIVDAHLRSLQPGHLEDVASSDQHTVKPWFDGKVDFSPPVRDFAGQGFVLQGGRLDVVGGRTVAVLVYGRRKHLINVFIWPVKGADSAPSSGSQLGYHWVDWRTGGLELCAVSDVSPEDLSELQRLFAQ